MSITIDLGSIKERTLAAQISLANQTITQLPDNLRKAAGQGGHFLRIATLSGFKSYGQLSFDGNPEHLRPQHRIVWEYLTEQGLEPFFYTTTNKGDLGAESINGATKYHMIARWDTAEHPDDQFLIQELRAHRAAAIARIASDHIEKIPAMIENALKRGEDWTMVYSFQGLAKPDTMLPFDGAKKNLTGVAKLIWAWLEQQGLSPRLYSVVFKKAHVPQVGEVDFGDDGAYGYRIAARWYDLPEIESASAT